MMENSLPVTALCLGNYNNNCQHFAAGLFNCFIRILTLASILELVPQG